MNVIPSPGARTVPIEQASTDEVPADERLPFWEAYTARALIGVRCSSFAAEGLVARQRNYELGALRLAEIAGNEHVVERTPTIMRRHPKDSVFACFLIEGEAFFYQSGRCVQIHAGDMIVYGTTQPYLYGFNAQTRHVHIDIAHELLAETCPVPADFPPIRIDAGLRSGQRLAQTLRDDMSSFIELPLAERAPAVSQRLRSALEVLLRACVLERASGPDLRLLRAESFIAEHLPDPQLDAESVARHVATSLRNLNRVFERHGSSVTQWIWHERLVRASAMLADPAQLALSIGDIALRCGFATQAHFARAFRERFGCTPSERRRAAGGASTPPSSCLHPVHR